MFVEKPANAFCLVGSEKMKKNNTNVDLGNKNSNLLTGQTFMKSAIISTFFFQFSIHMKKVINVFFLKNKNANELHFINFFVYLQNSTTHSVKCTFKWIRAENIIIKFQRIVFAID